MGFVVEFRYCVRCIREVWYDVIYLKLKLLILNLLYLIFIFWYIIGMLDFLFLSLCLLVGLVIFLVLLFVEFVVDLVDLCVFLLRNFGVFKLVLMEWLVVWVFLIWLCCVEWVLWLYSLNLVVFSLLRCWELSFGGGVLMFDNKFGYVDVRILW